jgi:hypothetical protein
MNQLSIIAIIGAAMLVGMTVQHQALAYSRDDALAGSLSKICDRTGKSINPICNSRAADTNELFILPTP